jgi:flagellum-specific peptidoglycan hydrolase FlgJ
MHSQYYNPIMRYLLLFVVGFLCAGIFHHIDSPFHKVFEKEQNSNSHSNLHNPQKSNFDQSAKLFLSAKNKGDYHNLTEVIPRKMELPLVELQWGNIWYYLKGEPYIRGVETRLSLEPNENRDYVQLQRQAAQWIVQSGARDWNNGYRSSFLKEIATDVLLSAQEHNLYPSVIFAQSILESGWGRSRLAVQYNNLFGIKGYSTDIKVRTTTYEKINGRRVAHQASFRVFSSWGEAIQYHGDLLSTDTRYQHASNAQSYEEYIRLIAEKYASEPDYADLVVQLVERYDLDRWDAFFMPTEGDIIVHVVSDGLLGSMYQEKQNFKFIQTTY